MIDQTLVVLKKEALDAWRDRRSLVSASAYALWAPVAVAIALTAIARDRSADQPLEITVAGASHAPSLIGFLTQQPDVHLSDAGDPHDAVRARRTDVALVIDADYPAAIAGSKPAALDLIYDGARSGSLARAGRVRRLIGTYSTQVADSRLLLRGIVPDVATPVAVRDRDVSTAAGRAGHLLAMLPIFLLVAAFTGGMNVAIDATAGERERGSLESLLVHPVSTLSVVVGKWAAAAAASVASIVLMIAVTAAVLSLPRIRAIDLPIGLSLDEAIVTALVLLPLAALAPALQMLVSVFAASYKEAQTHVSLLLFVPIVPGFLISFGSIVDSPLLRLVPIASQQLIVNDVLTGMMPAPRAAGAGAGATVIAAVLALSLTASLLGRERSVAGLTP